MKGKQFAANGFYVKELCYVCNFKLPTTKQK